MKLLNTKRSFRLEFKRQIRLAVVAAIGFTIAFAWRNAIFDIFHQFISKFLEIDPNHFLSETYTAVFITLLGVICIFITSNFLKEKNQ